MGVYYNNGDLGIGRQMHCKVSGSATACYVSNYADTDAQGKPIFGGTPSQQQDAIQLAISNGPPIATVAMIYDSTAPSGQTVKFIVYQTNTHTQLTAPLDNHAVHGESGSNTAIPTNCLACHGGAGSYSTSTNLVTGAHFLAFDPYSYVYSATDSTRSQSSMAPTFQAFNEMVYNAGATNTTKAMLQAMYNSTSDPNHGTGVVADAVPSGWTDDWNEKQLYTNVVAPYCRTCHSSRDDAFSWATYAGFAALQSDHPDPHLRRAGHAARRADAAQLLGQRRARAPSRLGGRQRRLHAAVTRLARGAAIVAAAVLVIVGIVLARSSGAAARRDTPATSLDPIPGAARPATGAAARAGHGRPDPGGTVSGHAGRGPDAVGRHERARRGRAAPPRRAATARTSRASRRPTSAMRERWARSTLARRAPSRRPRCMRPASAWRGWSPPRVTQAGGRSPW